MRKHSQRASIGERGMMEASENGLWEGLVNE